MITDIEKDKRVRRSRRLLKEAFIFLVTEKGYKSVTVKDIINKADYNRTTFYAHFSSKEELTEVLVTEMIEGLEDALLEPYQEKNLLQFGSLKPSSLKLFEYIEENSRFFNLLLKDDTIPNLQDKVIDMIFNLFKDEITFLSDLNTEANTENFATYRTYGIFGIILMWIKSGYIQSPEELSRQLIVILNSYTHGVRKNK
ncbi:TetR/AcrR family transcriptional regulator [Bacillus sp. FJAT-22090]|uniref:TetR/AcrR family transcriptional regulator n=1 Tax=Bacillus sp. FJAT-22090 TaxID=1581038 RepID=UPI0006AF177C|nr:TetR/AcrR family transcriptional regulator [Bacillus sp. FJAT-22090]